jgi:hypothetical protein
MDQAIPAHQTVLRDIRERGEDPNLDCRFGLYAGGDREKKLQLEASLPNGFSRI